jgi:hypothetical protein
VAAESGLIRSAVGAYSQDAENLADEGWIVFVRSVGEVRPWQCSLVPWQCSLVMAIIIAISNAWGQDQKVVRVGID